jgi:multidrug resistance efflux pump
MTDASPTLPPSPKQSRLGDWSRKSIAYIVTLVVVGFAILLAIETWYLYMRAPWTRDAFVRVEVTNIAPEGVSGYVTNLPVIINQRVKQGDLLFQIDPTRYELAVTEAKANLKVAEAEAALALAFAESRRRAGNAVSQEDRQTYIIQAETTRAMVESAKANLDLAQYNLYRTKAFAPSDGWVANMMLRVGDYVASGEPAMILLNEESFWVEAYFEETKLAGVKPGDEAVVTLMANRVPLKAEVISLSRGIANTNNDPGFLGLQQVNPVDAWVRLAQRIPVYVRLKELPEDLPLVAGMTASVAVGELAQEILNPTNLGQRLLQWLDTYL